MACRCKKCGVPIDCEEIYCWNCEVELETEWKEKNKMPYAACADGHCDIKINKEGE